jgi:hypothetical protein
MDLEEDETTGRIVITGISGTGSADGKNVRVGDILRAVTAREKRMAYPEGNVVLGGIGRPQMVTSFVPIDKNVDFGTVLEAIKSNILTSDSSPDPAMRTPGEVTMLLERPIKK